MATAMETTEKVVLGILETLVSEDKRKALSLCSALREDLGLDSFKLISLVMELQSKTDFDITMVENEDDLKSVTTVQDLVTIVNNQCSSGNAAKRN